MESTGRAERTFFGAHSTDAMKMRFPIAACVAALFASLVFAGCEKNEQKPAGETATYGSFQLVADETLRPVVDSLISGFSTENPEAHITVKYTSAAEAVRELLNHDTRAIVIDRMLTPMEEAALQKDSTTLPVYKLAEDGIGCIVSADNTHTTVRKSDLARMFRGEATGWGDITIVLPQYPSSAEYILDSTLLGSGAQTNAYYLRRFSTTDSIIAYVRDHSKSIGFIGSAWKHWMEEHNDSSIKVLPVIPADSSSRGLTEPVLLHMAYVAEGLYPLVSRVNGYSFEVPNTVPRGFLAYASTAHGQTVFKNFEVLPITQPIRLVKSRF